MEQSQFDTAYWDLGDTSVPDQGSPRNGPHSSVQTNGVVLENGSTILGNGDINAISLAALSSNGTSANGRSHPGHLRPNGTMNPRKDKRRRSTKSEKWHQAWNEFCNNTTFHGFKQIAEQQPYLFRRVFWVALVLGGLSLFVYQMTTGVIYFLSYPTSVNVRINYNDSILVPALTICNQNAFRKTSAVEHGWYSVLTTEFSDSAAVEQDVNTTDGRHISDVTMYDIYNRTGHSLQDMIVRCTWNGAPCREDDFIMTMTDYGKCYTFNKRGGRFASRTGTEGGLRILLNVEQYEYMPGPNQGAGLRVLVHNHGDVPLLRDFGVAVPPGSHTLLGTTLMKVQNLPLPHGTCVDTQTLVYYDVYSKINCFQNCRQKFIENRCNCVTKEMVSTEDSTLCTVQQHHQCVDAAIAYFNNKQRSQCVCAIPCHYDIFQLTNSYGDISHFDALNLLHSNLTDQLQPKYVAAQEVDQRVNVKNVQDDTKQILTFEKALTHITILFDNILIRLNEARNKIEDMFAVLEQRLNFHKVKGLDKVLYIMEHDFVRGWTILEERTIPFLTFNFFEIRGSFRRIIYDLRNSTNDTEAERILSLSLWRNLRNVFHERLDITHRVYDNLTEVHEKYKSGDPILTYRSSLNRRYDMTWITVEMLQAMVNNDTHDQDFFYETIIKRVDLIVQCIHRYLDMGQTFVETSTINETLWEETDVDFRFSCVSYNYYTFLFKSRIVNSPVIVARKKIEEFDRLNRTLYTSKSALLADIDDIQQSILEMNSGSQWGSLGSAVADGISYLNGEKTKVELAKSVNSVNMANIINTLNNFFNNLRSHDYSLQEQIENFKLATGAIWTNMLSDYSTAKFYNKVNEDFNTFIDNRTLMLPYFADLLDVTVSAIENTSIEELQYRLNADFNDIVLSDKLVELDDFFVNLHNITDVRKTLGSSDDFLVTSLGELRASLGTFQQNIIIDTAFYMTNFIQLDVYMKELSYEEILQQPAYDLLNLLGDIGGSLGLFLGASALTVVELADMFVMQCVRMSKIG